MVYPVHPLAPHAPRSSPNNSIFVSYRHGLESAFAVKIAADLKNAGLTIWVDRLDGVIPGADWRLSIEHAINVCAAMIAVVSPDYVASTYCRNELARAEVLGRPIFPVLLHPVPDIDWPLPLQRQHYLDFTAWHDATIYRARLDELLCIGAAFNGNLCQGTFASANDSSLLSGPPTTDVSGFRLSLFVPGNDQNSPTSTWSVSGVVLGPAVITPEPSTFTLLVSPILMGLVTLKLRVWMHRWRVPLGRYVSKWQSFQLNPEPGRNG
jgi:hypothetical protein